MPHLAPVGQIAFFSRAAGKWMQDFSFVCILSGLRSCQEGSHTICICTNSQEPHQAAYWREEAGVVDITREEIQWCFDQKVHYICFQSQCILTRVCFHLLLGKNPSGKSSMCTRLHLCEPLPETFMNHSSPDRQLAFLVCNHISHRCCLWISHCLI